MTPVSVVRGRAARQVKGRASRTTREPTMISTTRMAILHNELPRERRFVKDSCPGVSIMRRPGTLNSCFSFWGHSQEK